MTKKTLPSYSVLMATYARDVPSYLDAAIASMESQTAPFHDLVLVCDGPLPEELDECVDTWSGKLAARMTVVRLPVNGGLGTALDAGLGMCGCDVVARMDADDLSRPERMEKLLGKMVDGGFDLVGGAIEEFDARPGDMGRVRMPPLEADEIGAWMRRRNPFNHMTVVFDRRAVERAGGYEPFRWMEDYWLWARMLHSGCRCANVPDVVVDVRTGNGMYARRSNVAYLRSQVLFFGELRRMGFASRIDFVRAVVERTLAALLPTAAVKAVYNGLLRERRAAC